jgi:GTP-binding protein
MLELIESTPPPSVHGRFPKFKYVTQLPTHYPSFVFFVNNPNWVRDSYKQFLENQLRKNFDFKGVTMEVYIRAKS